MNLKFIKNIGTVELYIDVDTLQLITKREYSEDSLEILQALQNLETSLNIPKILQIEKNGGNVITYEQYIEGITLQELISRGEFIKTSEFEKYIRELIYILQTIHSRGIIHKDIKPANIVLSREGLYLIDFNISRKYKEEQSKDTKLFGTDGYASPEQYGFSQTTTKSDVYSLGKTLTELLSVTITSAEEYVYYDKLFKQMVQLDPEARIDLNQVLEAVDHKKVGYNDNNSRQSVLMQRLDIGIIQTRGGTFVALLVSIFFLMYSYEVLIENKTYSSQLILWLNTGAIYYFGSLVMNYKIIPFSRKLWQRFKAKNIIIKAVVWPVFRTVEIIEFAFVIFIPGLILTSL